ncbi:MAG: hypothetical protein ACJ74H_02735, partial [Thermoanaerobaculia bacterium]
SAGAGRRRSSAILVVMEQRFCSNCRAELGPKDDACPACGVFAGDVFDERSLRPRTRRVFLLVFIVVIALAAAWFLIPTRFLKREPAPAAKPAPPSTRVVHDRPGGARRAAGASINEAEAIRLLRGHLASTMTINSSCLVVMSHGPSKGDYYFTAYNRCDNVRIGRWRVDGKSGAVELAKASH